MILAAPLMARYSLLIAITAAAAPGASACKWPLVNAFQHSRILSMQITPPNEAFSRRCSSAPQPSAKPEKLSLQNKTTPLV